MPRLIALILFLTLLLGGCANVNRHPNSFDSKKENVSIKLLSQKDFPADSFATAYAQHAQWSTEDPRMALLAKRVDEVIPKSAVGPEDSPFLTAAAIPGIQDIVGLGIDLLQAELDEEAGRYERQFRSSVKSDAFWHERSVPNWIAFEIVRTTRDHAEAEPAFRFLCAMVPSEYDQRFFLLQPLFLQVQSSKAKVAKSGGSMSVKVDVQMQGAWIDAQDQFHSGPIASAIWRTAGYNLDSGSINHRRVDDDDLDAPGGVPGARFFFEYETPGDPDSTRLRNFSMGWFAGVPWTDRDDNNGPGGPFELTAVVTERDESKARQIIERTSELLSDNRSKILNYAGGGSS